MAASMVRSFRRCGQVFLRKERTVIICSYRSCRNERTIIDKTVPYFPEDEKKRSVDAEYPEVEISHDEFKYVERLIPPITVPEVPKCDIYPTPSGWIPPDEKLQPAEYAVRRSRNHMLPCYYKKHFSGRESIKVKFIYGDIWKFKEDALEFFKKNDVKEVDIQVHEVGRFVRFRGNCHDTVAKFLLSKGF